MSEIEGMIKPDENLHNKVPLPTKYDASRLAKEILTRHLLTVDMEYTPAAIDEVLNEATIEGLTLKACLNAVMEALQYPQT